MKPILFIDGDQGTTGLRIHELLRGRTELDIRSLPDGARKDPAARTEALNDCDIAILCLPDDAAREAVSWVRNPRVRIIDASSAHRIQDGWVYGFAELEPGQAARIARARRVSNPGCYPTGALALLRPLIDDGLLTPDEPVTIHAVSGYSGRGRSAVQSYEGPCASPAPAFQVYSLGLEHKHVPEIMRQAGLRRRPVFVPSYGAFRQGIVLTIALDLNGRTGTTNLDSIRDALRRRYEGVEGIRVLSAGQSRDVEAIDPCALNGSNDLELAVFGNGRHGHALLTAVFDNLGKGAAGAAVQNLDLMLGGA